MWLLVMYENNDDSKLMEIHLLLVSCQLGRKLTS